MILKCSFDIPKAVSGVVRPTHVKLLSVDPLVRAGEGGGQGGQAEQRGEGEEEHGELRQRLVTHWPGICSVYTVYSLIFSVL